MRLLDDSAVCELFLEKLECARIRLSFRVYGYVLMPTHVHMLISEPDHGTLADALHSLKLSVSKAAHRRYPISGCPTSACPTSGCPTFSREAQRRGITWGLSSPEHSSGCPTFANLTWGIPSGEHTRLWQSRYYDRNVRDYEEFREKLRYIHRNPVKRGLCARPENWPWSSFLHYATGTTGPVEIESEWTARRREVLALPERSPR